LNDYNFVKYPNTVVTLAKELIRVLDDYNEKIINNNQIQNIISWYKDNYADKLFRNNDYNPSIKKIIGKQRITQLNKIIEHMETNEVN